MKAEDENQNADEAFERELAGFHRAEPPVEWRDELLVNAIPELNPVPARKTQPFAPRFSLPEKFFGGALAAAWLVIFSLWMTTPDDHQSADASPSSPLKSSAPTQSERFPMLAWRFASGEAGEELFP